MPSPVATSFTFVRPGGASASTFTRISAFSLLTAIVTEFTVTPPGASCAITVTGPSNQSRTTRTENTLFVPWTDSRRGETASRTMAGGRSTNSTRRSMSQVAGATAAEPDAAPATTRTVVLPGAASGSAMTSISPSVASAAMATGAADTPSGRPSTRTSTGPLKFSRASLIGNRLPPP